MNKLEAYVHVYRSLQNPQKQGRNLSGTVPSEQFQSIVNILQIRDVDFVSNSADNSISMNLGSDQRYVFANDLNDLLAPSRRLKIPPNFYLQDIDYLYTGDAETVPQQVKQYFDAVELASALCKVADHMLEPPQSKAIFLQEKKLEVSLDYTTDDLRRINGLGTFITEFIEADIHKDQKSTIIKKVLLDMLTNNSIDRLTLPCIIRRFDEFVDRIKANYQLYVSEFSFEKIRAHVEEKKFDKVIKVNKVLSDIQNQLLAVPIALFLAATQMTSTGEITIKNTFILIGYFTFFFLTRMLINNQRTTLDAIKKEVDFQWNIIKQKHIDAASRLSSYQGEVGVRISMQSDTLRLIEWVNLALLVTVSIIFSYHSGFFATALEKLIIFWGNLILVAKLLPCGL